MSQKRQCRVELCTTAEHQSLLCGRHFRNLRDRGDVQEEAPAVITKRRIDALWARLSTAEALAPGPCWDWPGSVNVKGYGMTKRHGESVANRAAWVEAHGAIPDGLYVLHHCDNPPCVRPSHLYVGTPAQNSRDASNRKRFGPRHNEFNAHTRLDSDAVNRIRQRVAGGETRAAVSRDLGITPSHISRICSGQARLHVPWPAGTPTGPYGASP